MLLDDWVDSAIGVFLGCMNRSKSDREHNLKNIRRSHRLECLLQRGENQLACEANVSIIRVAT